MAIRYIILPQAWRIVLPPLGNYSIALLKETEALADTIERARQYGRRAIDALAMFPASKAKAALTEAAEFAVARAY